jgi:hypothetical protein
MVIRTPTLDGTQIENWMRQSASQIGLTSGFESLSSRPAEGVTYFDFKKARQALQRARKKSSPRTIKPLRRLRTNQAAVNESLADALSALLAVNKAMASELTALGTELAQLRARLPANGSEPRSIPETHA